MTRVKRRAGERLLDMADAMNAIARYAPRGRAAFDGDELVRTWMLHHLQIVGEAANALPHEVRAQAGDVPWDQIIGMRHILVHGYFALDDDIVWAVIAHDLAPLRAAVERLIAFVDRTPGGGA